MSLAKAIKFRHLSSKLTREERTRFLSQLVHSHTDILLTSLFQHLAKPNHIGELNGFNNTLSDIIQSREEKPKPLCMTNIKIDQLPMTINIVNCHHVTTLKCKYFGSNHNKMGRNEFLSLLTKFPNVTQLQLHSVEVTQDVTAQDIAGLCPKLVGLLLANTRLIGDLVKMFASQLQYLAFYHRTTLDFGNVVFDQLEELGIFWPRNQLFCDIVKSAFKLKRLYISYWKDRTSHDQIKKSITFVMVQCKCLNYMHFSIGHPKSDGVNTTQFCSVLEGIECGLLKTKQQQRKRLKVCINVAGLGFKSSDFVLNIGTVINSFCTSNVKDFMLIWQFEGGRDNATLDEVFHALCNLSAHIKVIQSEERFIVTNKNCKINGYQNELNFLSASKRF
eukprot:397687_1